MNEAKVARVESVIGTKACPLPVRYLGLPLTSKKLSRKDCDNLITKMTARLECWSNRFLSRAGRKVLVSAVLQAMVFFLGVSLFLWKGRCDKKGGHLVSWEKVCRDKKKGGLGIKDIELMNYSMVINQMWGNKDGNTSAWTEWMDKYWPKGKRWWEDEVKADSSWILRAYTAVRRVPPPHPAPPPSFLKPSTIVGGRCYSKC
ncbi:hypothetical protein QQ045_017864 [Rhodiola kirilowii]